MFDRGYFSFAIFQTLNRLGVKAIFRLKQDALKIASHYLV